MARDPKDIRYNLVALCKEDIAESDHDDDSGSDSED